MSLKISQMNTATPSGDAVVPLVQSSANVKATLKSIWQSAATFISSVAGAIFRTPNDKMGEFLSAKDFGVLANGANCAVAMNIALAAALVAGKKLLVPAGTYRYDEPTPGAGYAFLNPGVSVVGEGMLATIFAPLATFPNTADCMLVHPAPGSDISGIELSNFFISPDFDGTVRGRRGIYFLFDIVTNLSKLRIDRLTIRPCNNYAIEIASTIAINPQGVPAYSVVENCLLFDGIKAFGIGDSNIFQANFHNTPAASGRHGLWLHHVDGTGGVSSHTIITGNAMSCDGASLLVDRGRNIKFFWNNVEAVHGTGSAGAAVVDINGADGAVPMVEIKGNHFGIFGTTLVNKVVRLNAATTPEVEANTFLSGFLLTDCINITAACSDAYIGRNAMNTTVFSNPVNNSGSATAGVTTALAVSGGYSAAGGGYAVPSYFKTKENTVILKGTGAGVAIASTTVIGTLPGGYRPALTERFTVNATIGGVATTAVIEVASNGQIQYIGAGAATLICLSGLTFTTTPIVLGTT